MHRKALLLALAAVGLCLNGVSAASCASPALSVTPSTAAPATAVTIEVTALYDGGCPDTGTRRTFGCVGPERPRDPFRPAKGATVELVLVGGTVSLGELEPGKDGYRTRSVRLPAALGPGTGELRVLSKSGHVLATTPLTVEGPEGS